MNMHVLKDTDSSRIVGIPLSEGSSGMVKYQIQRRFGETAFETITEVTVVGSNHEAGNVRAREMLSVSDLQLLLADASSRLSA